MNNLSIWSQVEKTDTRYTKAAKVGGQQITSLSGTAMIMKATEIFGPAGIGFGWKVLEERFDPGIEVFSGEGDKRVSLGFTSNHTVRIAFWFMLDGQRGEIESYGCTNYVYKASYGMLSDGEAPKKSLTDAIKKALSALGFSADVFLGLHDDANYLEQLNDELAIERAEDKVEEEARQKQERLDYIKSVVETMGGAQSAIELKKIHDVAVRKLAARRDDKAVTRISREYEEQKSRFEQKEVA
ncbi:hypothetical protein LT697_00680 [Pseudomonas syringae pv. syringae]|uniref:hypothetical protein n=1 Tax=Pseudomonas syringae TaxID=317 RepID=UPI00200AC1C3|nr:hypothetical protein [Pseudomonas syringae]MCK9740059.1 hypothetical protein [Pseudomonas syringae pv. syringae]